MLYVINTEKEPQREEQEVELEEEGVEERLIKEIMGDSSKLKF